MAMPDCPNLPRFSFIHGIILGQTIMFVFPPLTFYGPG